MPCFFMYNLSMKKLMEIAKNELDNLKKERNPSWATFEKMAVFATCIDYMQSEFYVPNTSIGEMLQNMRNTLGSTATLDVVIKVLDAFCDDINCVSPHLIECLKERLRETAKK